MHSTQHIIAVLAFGSLYALGCSPTYAPPMRSTHYGAPGRLGPHEGAVYAAGGIAARARGGLGITIPVSDAVRVEAQGNLSDEFATGSGGVRVVHRADVLAIDGELGLGAGVGGARCGNNSDTRRTCEGSAIGTDRLVPDGLGAWDRVAYGGYAGVGMGVRARRWLELYGRGALQLSTTTGVPTTLWASAMGGAQFTIGPIDLHVAAGYVGFFNERYQINGVNLEAGLAVPFGRR